MDDLAAFSADDDVITLTPEDSVVPDAAVHRIHTSKCPDDIGTRTRRDQVVGGVRSCYVIRETGSMHILDASDDIIAFSGREPLAQIDGEASGVISEEEGVGIATSIDLIIARTRKEDVAA